MFQVENFNNKNLTLLIFLISLFFALLISFLVNLFLIPVIYKNESIVNEVGNTLINLDSVYYHKKATMMVNSLLENNLSILDMLLENPFITFVTALIYYCFEPNSIYILPFNAIIHGLTSCIIFLILRCFFSKSASFYSIFLFICHPQSIEWYSQILKDGMLILGMSLFFLYILWTLKFIKNSLSNKILYLYITSIIGLCLVYFNRIKIIKAEKYDLIHTHLPRSDFIGGIIKLFFPKIIWISTLHDAYIKGVYSGYKVLYFLKFLYYKADSIIVVSNYIKTWAIRKLSITEKKIFEIQHGINNKKIISKTKLNKNINLGCLARFEKRKGIDKLIKIMPEILKISKETKLYIAGNDPFGYKNDLQNEIKKLNLEKNIFLKSFTNETDKFMKNIDIYVYPSIAEGFGLSILEALNNKLPVICFDISPLNRIIIDKKNGFLVKFFDLEDFKKKILELIKNKKLRKKLSNHGNKYLIDNFSIGTMISKVENLYN